MTTETTTLEDLARLNTLLIEAREKAQTCAAALEAAGQAYGKATLVAAGVAHGSLIKRTATQNGWRTGKKTINRVNAVGTTRWDGTQTWEFSYAPAANSVALRCERRKVSAPAERIYHENDLIPLAEIIELAAQS